VTGEPAATQSLSLKISGATVTDWTPPVIASSVVQLPFQGLGASNAVLVPAPAHGAEFAAAISGRAHDPMGAPHEHAPQGGDAGALPWK
jgi:hypothetical protein